MPQITLEHSSNIHQEIRTGELLGSLHRVIADVLELSIDNCKSRVVVHDDYLVGVGGDQKAFVHVCVRILSGRTPKAKTKVGQALLALLDEYFAPSASTLQLQLTVEVQDIDREAYFKKNR